MRTYSQDRALSGYFKDIKPFKQLKKEEELALIRQYKKTKDKKILHKIVSANLRFVVSVAIEFKNDHVDIKDLINEGNLGLIKAVERFNVNNKKNVKFLSYAVWWIRQSIFTSLYETGRLVRYPANKVSLINKINKMHETMEFYEIAQKLKISEKDLAEIISYEAISMDKDFRNKDDSFTLHDKLAQEEEDLDGPAQKEQLLKLLFAILDEREKFILRQHALKLPLHVIGKKLNITRERVRQIKAKSITKMRNYFFKNHKAFKAVDI